MVGGGSKQVNEMRVSLDAPAFPRPSSLGLAGGQLPFKFELQDVRALSPSLVLGYHCVTPFHIPEALGCPATLN
jgi:hypothetical protein